MLPIAKQFSKGYKFQFYTISRSWGATKVYWCKPSRHRAIKKPFAKGNENELVNICIKRQHTKFIKLRNIFTSEVQLITTCKLPACRVDQNSTFRLPVDQHVSICFRMV